MSSRKAREAEASVTVAVRVRPFTARELSGRTRSVVSMNGSTTLLYNPFNSQDDPKAFTFDYSYWSHDRFVVGEDGYLEPARGSNYADQEKIFEDIGRRMVDQAWEGYNSAVFAYGQAGSGKSYTIMGEGANTGLVPRSCNELFRKIQDHRNSDVTFQVTLNMLEIYNERVHDLLSSRMPAPGGLRVRGSIEHEFYVEDLVSVVVTNREEVERLITEGNRKRTIASTRLNEASNRSHTIVTIVLTQTRSRDEPSLRATIKFVDLAGSERFKQTEATGDRFTESKNINLSLLTLGNVIADLVEKRQKLTTRYRESVLTKLLMNALGGNCKTTMIATISPDAENYDQTVGTLRYASRVKYIRTEPTVNHVMSAEAAAAAAERDALIESERSSPRDSLHLESGRSSADAKSGAAKSSASIRGYTENYVVELRKKYETELQTCRQRVETLEVKYRQQLADTERQLREQEKKTERHAAAADKTDAAAAAAAAVAAAALRPPPPAAPAVANKVDTPPAKIKHRDDVAGPYLTNLNEDPSLTGKLRHLCKPGKSRVGNDGHSDIILYGPGIVTNHAEIINDEPAAAGSAGKAGAAGAAGKAGTEGSVTLVPRDGQILHNGQPIKDAVRLTHDDRIRFGSNNFFIFHDPRRPAAGKQPKAPKEKKAAAATAATAAAGGPEALARNRTFTYQDAQQEIVHRSAVDIREAVKDDAELLQEVAAVLPVVHNVEAMAKEMEKPVEFTLVIVPAEARGFQDGGRPEVQVKLLNKKNGCKYMWTKEKFMVRQEYMKNMYEEFMESGKVPNWNKEHDPFWEPVDLEQVVGTVSVPLESLARLEALPECRLSIVDYMANNCGQLHVRISPCDKNGRELTRSSRVNPKDLIGKSVAFKLTVLRATDLPPRFVKSWCKYHIFDNRPSKTREIDGENPAYSHEEVICVQQVDDEVLDFLSHKSLIIEVCGSQGRRSPTTRTRKSLAEDDKAKNEVDELQRKLGAIRQLAGTAESVNRA